MKRVGELYEVVVFTASVSKVRLHEVDLCVLRLTWTSMGILYWINWIFIMSSIIVYFERVATITKAIMSRIFHKSAVIYEKL